MGFSESFRNKRLELGLSQSEIAKMLSISQGLVSQYENGVTSPTISLAVRIAKMLGTTCEAMVCPNPIELSEESKGE